MGEKTETRMGQDSWKGSTLYLLLALCPRARLRPCGTELALGLPSKFLECRAAVNGWPVMRVIPFNQSRK